MVLTVVIVLILISLAVYLGYTIHLALKPDARLASVMAETELAKIGGEPRTLKINLDDTKVVIMKKSEGFGIYTNDPELKCSCDEEKIEITSTSEKCYNARRYVKIVLPEILSFENVIIRQTSGGIEGDLLSCKNLDIRAAPPNANPVTAAPLRITLIFFLFITVSL